MSDWQPIETAPMDGTKIMVAEGPYVSIASWGDLNENPDNPFLSWKVVDPLLWGYLTEPTHWMTMPEPPK